MVSTFRADRAKADREWAKDKKAAIKAGESKMAWDKAEAKRKVRWDKAEAKLAAAWEKSNRR